MDFEISQEKNEGAPVDSGSNVETVGAASAVAGADTVGSDVIPIGSITSRGKGRRKKASNRGAGGGNGGEEGDHEEGGEKEKKIDPRSIEVAHLIAALLADDKEKVKDHAANLIGSGVLVGDLPEPDVKLAVVVDDECNRLKVAVNKDTGLVKRISDDEVKAIVGRYLHEGSSKGRLADALVNGEKLTATTIRFRAEILSALAVITGALDQDDIAFFKQRDDAGLAWFILPYRFEEHIFDDTPWYDEFISRCGNAKTQKAVMAFIGSLFVKEADRSQYIYFYGEGKNTKGRFCTSIFHGLRGMAHAAQECDQNTKRFWARTNVVGRRAVVFEDLGDPNFVTSAFFKGLTGFDYLTSEGKNKDGFMSKIFCKFIIASNKKPAVKSNMADMRRAIFVEPALFTGESLSEGELAAIWDKEAPGFFAKCYEVYLAEYPRHGWIKGDQEALAELAEDNEAIMRDIVASRIRPLDGVGTQAMALAALLHEHGISTGLHNRNAFIKLIEKMYGINVGGVEKVKSNGVVVRAHWGFGIVNGVKGGTIRSLIADRVKDDTKHINETLKYVSGSADF